MSMTSSWAASTPSTVSGNPEEFTLLGYEETQVPEIFGLISKISNEAGALAPEKNGGVPFAFRGVDAVVSHISPLMKKYGVIVIPEVLRAEHSGRAVGTKWVTQTELQTQFTFYAPDGSHVSAITAGLAQDFADRSAAQAQSVAFRVALLQVFALPTTDKEPEVVGEEVQAVLREEHKKASASKPAAGPNVTDLQAAIKGLIQGTYSNDKGEVFGPIPGVDIDKVGDRISGKSGAAWKRDAKVLAAVIEELTSK